MREILFRGKRIDNGEWIKGFYCQAADESDGGTRIKQTILVPTFLCQSGFEQLEVDFETVGQFTGLTDKNGKNIYEGDIVEYPIESGGYKRENIHEVVFENRDGTAYFGIKMSNMETWRFDMDVPVKLMKVIGNIHDNPELLER